MADELETRLAAIELLIIEVLSDLEPQRLLNAIDRIGTEGADELERDARAGAVNLLEDALKRHDVFDGTGFVIPKRD